jgi:NADH-quinone oxidoreductase subunit L
MSHSFLVTILLLLPFAGFLTVASVSRQLAGRLAVAFTGVGLLLSILAVSSMPAQAETFSITWAQMPQVPIHFSLRLDTLTAVMLLLVHFIALLVQLYSIDYLHDEPKLARYFSSLQLFVGAMLGIVLAGNLLVLYGFWELVGLASYLLIGFYSDRPAAGQAAKKAFLMNRVGDIGFLLGIFLTYYYYDTFELSVLLDGDFATAPATVIGLCLFMGCVGKSAQFPLLTWLPDAMEGPTPVSALLHAATMVAAGIFLLARIQPLLSPDALIVITVVGTITTLWGGYSAIFQTDIKKVLAFSTVSQLGMMVAGMGTGNVSEALFHLLTHAFFKAGLFLSAGSIIHAVHTQDMRQMGGLRRAMPMTFVGYTICAAALSGVPLLSGFLSKEALIGGVFTWAGQQPGSLAYGIPILLLVSSGMTALYMTRQWQLIFFGNYRNESVSIDQLHEPSWLMRGPVLLLALLSVAFWFSLNPVSAHGSWFLHLFPATESAEYIWLAPVSIALVLIGGWVGFQMKKADTSRLAVRLSIEYGFLDSLYKDAITNPSLRFAHWLNKTDQKVIDGAVNGSGVTTVVLAHLANGFDRFGVDGLVNGAAWLAGQLGKLTRSVQNGLVQSYITAAVVGLLLMLWWLL